MGDLLQAEGLPARRIAVVPNFVDAGAFEPPADEERRALMSALGLRGDAPTIGVVANLHPVKDHASLLRATASLRQQWPDLQVIFIGDGERRSALEGLASELGIRDQVIFAGRRSNQPNLHHLFDISVLCSTSEGLPNSILEAMAAGKPVVATSVGAIPDAVVHGETGILVPPSAPADLAAALSALLADPAKSRAMGLAGQRRARETFSPEGALSSLARLYESLVAARTARSPGWHSPKQSSLVGG
jgi:L-malate glycosyltransferase